MKNLIFAAVIGLTVSGQAWAWDDEDEPILYGGKYRTMAEWDRAKERQDKIDSDIQQRQFNESQMIWNQWESLDNQKEMLKIEKRRLELEEERARRRDY
jgi:hypothetical protein